jgi:hypothetical protein
MQPRVLAPLLLLLAIACGGGAASTPGGKAAPGVPGVREGGVYEVFDAAGRAFVALGEAHRTPNSAGAPIVIAQGAAVEIAEERALGVLLEVTVVGAHGTCMTRASSRVMLGRYDASNARWLDALELEGCSGQPALPRIALIGVAEQARWISPQEAMFVDGEAIRAAQFLEPNLGTGHVLRRYQFVGSDVLLERESQPMQGGTALRLMRGQDVLATYPDAAVVGAVSLVDRLLIVLDSDGLTVVEVVGRRAVTLLSKRGARPVD